MRSKQRLILSLFIFTLFTTITTKFTLSKEKRILEHKLGWSIKSLLDEPSERRFPILVILKTQADLTPAKLLITKEEKGKYVYHHLRETALSSQKEILTFLDSRRVEYHRFYIMNMIAVYYASKELIEELILRDDVSKIIMNPTIHQLTPKLTPASIMDAGRGTEASLTKVGADRVWKEFNIKGKGIVVAGQDSGVQWDHPALKKQYHGFDGVNIDHAYVWHDAIRKPLVSEKNSCGYDLKVPCDDNGHGTHTMGTIVGDDGENNQIGMAPESEWMACRNMDSGFGSPSTYIDCFEFFLAPYPQGKDPLIEGDPLKAPHVMNNSWGCPANEGCQGNELLPVLKNLAAAGIMVVASAGNDGPGCESISAPPAYHTGSTLSVGAYNHRTDKIAVFSSRGPSSFDKGVGPDIVAPGVSIRSSVPNNTYAGGWSGTSMAGPHVVGQVALLWSAKPTLIGKIEETSLIIKKSATPKTTTENCGNVSGTQIPNNTYGYGIIDAYKAIKDLIQ